jgi:hypothetical protein
MVNRQTTLRRVIVGVVTLTLVAVVIVKFGVKRPTDSVEQAEKMERPPYNAVQEVAPPAPETVTVPPSAVGGPADFKRARTEGEDRSLTVIQDALAKAEADKSADPKYVTSLRELRARYYAQRSTK